MLQLLSLFMNLFKNPKPLVKGGFYLILVLSLGYGFIKYDSARYNHGYSAARLELMETYSLEQSELKRLSEARVEALTSELNTIRKLSADNRDKAIELQKILDTTPTTTEVIREIEVIRDDCSDIPAYGRVLHSLIGQPPSIPDRPTKR